MTEANVAEQKKMITEVFCKGLVKGWNICVNFVMPNIVMSFILIKFLEQSGLLKMIGDFFGPAMELFGLPGEAATVLMASWLSQGGGVGVAAALLESGTLDMTQLAIVTPSIFIMGSQIQYIGRVLGVIGINKPSEMGILLLLPCITGILSLVFMRVIL